MLTTPNYKREPQPATYSVTLTSLQTSLISYDTPFRHLILLTQTEMALPNVHNKEMSLVLSSDAKPRLKWTPELHHQFVDAVNQLGGAEKATPKSLMRVMGIHGLTLYHLKSHLQKYRLGRSQQSQNYHQNKQEDNGDNQRSHLTNKICDGAKERIHESLQVARALLRQMEVRKLHEQIEVQRHLQLRIEAEGKYLQSILKKAQETLSGYSACSIEMEHARAQLSKLVSMLDSGCTSSSFSVLTDNDGLMLKDASEKPLGRNGYWLESSLTSSESSGELDLDYNHGNRKANEGKRHPSMLSLMEMNPAITGEPENQATNRKRSRNTIEEVNQREEPNSEKRRVQNSDEQVQRFKSSEDIDLNCNSLNDFDSGSTVIDLNSNGVELFGAAFSV